MPKAIIFDIDGTLIDSVDSHARAWQDVFKRYGREISFPDIRKQIGKGGDQLLPVFFGKEELAKFGEEMKQERARHFREKYLAHVRPFPQVRALLERLKAAGKRVVLASSANQEEVADYKRIARIEDLVEDEASADDAEKSKPHPDIFLAALERLRLPAADTVGVGDTPYDAEAAGKANIPTIGVRCGGFPEEELRRAGCVAIYDGPADLLQQFDNSPLK